MAPPATVVFAGKAPVGEAVYLNEKRYRKEQRKQWQDSTSIQ
jgi:hypothetical protein